MSTALLTLQDTLAQIRARRLRMEPAAGKLRCGPTASLTDPLREALRNYKRDLLPALRTWGPLTGLHVLYLLYEAVPSEPFQLDQARFVRDPALFLIRLYRDVQAGPTGPRARTGALQEDLRLLCELSSDKKIV